MGLARALKASLNASVLAASIIVSGSSFHSCPINGSLPSVLRCVIIMECPTWVWRNIYSTHYWPQRTKQVEQQSQGKRKIKKRWLAVVHNFPNVFLYRNHMRHLVYQYVLYKPSNSKLPSKDDHCFLASIQPIFMRCTRCRLRRERYTPGHLKLWGIWGQADT